MRNGHSFEVVEEDHVLAADTGGVQ